MTVSVPAATFVRDVGYWMSEALRQPVHITHLGRVRLVLQLPSDADQSALADPAAES